jgi:hypothetical protein
MPVLAIMSAVYQMIYHTHEELELLHNVMQVLSTKDLERTLGQRLYYNPYRCWQPCRPWHCWPWLMAAKLDLHTYCVDND